MGLITDHLHTLIAAQVRDPQVVVWFDPDGHYSAFAAALDLPGATVACYDGSFFALREQIDPLLRADGPPRLLVYVPLDPASDAYGNALIELTVSGGVLQPGAQDPARNTRLSFVARQALLAHPENWTADTAEEIARQIDAGQIASLAEADRAAEPGRGVPGVIPLLFETANAQEVALLFLDSPARDADIAAKDALPALADLFGPAYGADLAGAGAPAALRERLARHVLQTDFLATLAGPPPAQFATLAAAPDGPARDAAVRLARAWRNRRDLRDSYAAGAEHVEHDLGLGGAPFAVEQIAACETFLAVETALQERLEARLAAPEPWTWEEQTLWLGLIEGRLGDFWATWPERFPEVGARWHLIRTALQLLFLAARVESEWKTFRGGPEELLGRYAEGEQPWCLLDTYQRHLERRYHDFDLDRPGGRHESLARLIGVARKRYTAVGDALADRFVHAYAAAKFTIPGFRRQVEVFNRYVRPALHAGDKIAYVLVDALRFEMARELTASLAHDYDVTFSPLIGTVPTITDIGMAALMPEAETGAQVVPTGPGKLGLQVADTILRDRQSRLAWLREQVRRPVAVATLDDMLPKPKRTLDEELKAAELILVTSQEIDMLGESDNAHRAHKEMAGILTDLAKLMNKLRDYGCRQIVVTADHGYLFAEEVESDMSAPPPGGQTLDLHQRVWVGRGGTADAGFLRAPLKAFGLSQDLEIVVPYGFGVFTMRGGNTGGYFHGGMSPQELVVPLAILRPLALPAVAGPADITWDLKLGSRGNRITNRYFSVQVGGQVQTLFAPDLPRVRIEVRDKARLVAAPVSAYYGAVGPTGEIELRLQDADRRALEPNIVTLTITEETPPKSVAIVLLDAASGRTLKQIDNVAVSLAI